MFGLPSFIALFFDTLDAEGSSKSFDPVFVALGDTIFCIYGAIYFFYDNIYFFSAYTFFPPIIFLSIGGDFYRFAYSIVLVGVLLVILGIGGFNFIFS